MKQQSFFLFLILVFLFAIPLSFDLGCKKEWDVLRPEEKAALQKILSHWQTWVPERQKEGTAPLVSFVELYRGLDPEGQNFLDRVRAIKPREVPKETAPLKRIEGQRLHKNGKEERMDPQYLPDQVYRAYERMMKGMEKDLGRRLWIESGYRSPAYQLYTFLFYLPNHGYSLKETRRWVALPGHSEHGNPRRQAIDFVNEEGVNGDLVPEAFERLPEYRWLLRHANEFGFELSYPRGTRDTTFEPWHWRYVEKE